MPTNIYTSSNSIIKKMISPLALKWQAKHKFILKIQITLLKKS